VLGLLLALFSNLVELSILWKGFRFCLCFSSGGYPLPGCSFRLDPDGSDEAQQFAFQCSDDLRFSAFASSRRLVPA
jgi:hypothetical protein